MCGRRGCDGFPRLVGTEDEKRSAGCRISWDELAYCGHRWCPYCGQKALNEAADTTGRALETLTLQGWGVALGVFTFPHRLETPAQALVKAVRAGLKAISDAMHAWRTPEAHAAYSQLLRGERAGTLTPEARAGLLDTIRKGSIQATSRVELTVGRSGLHPHVNTLFLIPPRSSRPEGVYAGRIFEALEEPPVPTPDAPPTLPPLSAEVEAELDRLFPPLPSPPPSPTPPPVTPSQEDKKHARRYVHLGALERALHDVWTNATLGALQGADPERAYAYRAADAVLEDDVEERAERVSTLGPDHPHHPLALEDLKAAQARAAADSPERRKLRWRACSVLAWEGSVKTAAAYAFGQGSTWGAAQEAGGASGKANTLWRALDADATAPLWGAWCEATQGSRLTRASRGLSSWLEELAEQTPDASKTVKKRREVYAEAHPLVVSWARDQQREAELFEAASLGGVAGVSSWLSQNLPGVLRDLVEVRPPGVEVGSVEDDPDERRELRSVIAARYQMLGLQQGYWIGADGRPLTWVDADGCERKGRPPPTRAVRVKARADKLFNDYHKRIPGLIAEMGAAGLGEGVPLRAYVTEAAERAQRDAEREVQE